MLDSRRCTGGGAVMAVLGTILVPMHFQPSLQFIPSPQKQLCPKPHCPCAPCTSTLTPAGPLLKVLALLQHLTGTLAPATIAMQDWTRFALDSSCKSTQCNPLRSRLVPRTIIHVQWPATSALLPKRPCHGTLHVSVPVSCFMPAWPVQTKDQAKGGVSRDGPYQSIVLIHALPRYR